MKKMFFIPVIVISLLVLCLAGPALSAELLDVKPVSTATGVVIEVSADIPMTYTFYKVPGQARAVVDIADADPEKVEPLIVVNKGAVASISVDKAVIADMTVSRLVFNLVSESDISVTPAPDRKTLTVSFGGGKPGSAVAPAAPAAPAAAPVAAAAPAAPAVAAAAVPETKPQAPAAAPEKASSKDDEDDPLGLNEPQPAAAPAKGTAAAAKKTDPVAPVKADQPVSTVVVKGVVIGASYIDIQTNGPVEKFKQLKLSKPERLSIEIPGTSSMKMSSVQVKRFGVEKVRIGIIPGSVRVVLDTNKASFPKYEVVAIENGVRVNFK
jgi:hypothetical protein